MVSSHREMASEFLAILAWDEAARAAYAKALKSYQRAGSPGVPVGSVNYRKEFAKQSRKCRAIKTAAEAA